MLTTSNFRSVDVWNGKKDTCLGMLVYGIVLFACIVFPNLAVKQSVLGRAELSRGCKNRLVKLWKSTEGMTHFRSHFCCAETTSSTL